jgi:hypothetical protein
MPSEHMPADTSDRARYPEIKTLHGEDPARWLDWQILGDQDREFMVRTRIASIDEIGLCRAWIAVERDLDRQTRQSVISRLKKRIQELEEIGERPDRLEFGPRRPPELQDDVETRVSYVDDDGKRVPWDEVDRGVGLGSRSGLAVATDGGEDNVE